VLTLRLMGRHISLMDRLAVSSSLGLANPRDILRVLGRTVIIMLAVEGLGALILWVHWRAQGTVAPGDAAFYGLFHAVAAFCNAGFDLFGGLPQYPNGIPSDPVTLLTLGWLVILGGLGIPVYMDLLFNRAARKQGRQRRGLSLHTRLVLWSALILILAGWAGLLIIAGLIVLFVSLLSSHPLAFMLLLAVGCPLILVGVLLYLWSLAGGDGSGRANVVLVALLVIPLVVGGCGNEPPIPSPGNSAGGLPAFDPSTATAKVSGKLIFEGTAPTIPSLNIGRDLFCQKNGQSIFKKQALLTEGGAPRNVIVYVRSGFEGRSYATPQEAVVLDQQECVYVPHVLTVMKGQKLRILNGDPTFHNVHAESRGQSCAARRRWAAGERRRPREVSQPARRRSDLHRFRRGGEARTLQYPAAMKYLHSLFCVVVAACGELLRLWAAGHLEKSREVTTSGPYRFTRHPLYMGSTLIGIGSTPIDASRSRTAGAASAFAISRCSFSTMSRGVLAGRNIAL